MDEVREQRRGAVSGFVALAVGAVAVAFERGVPDPDRSPAEVLDFYVRNGSALLAQSLLFVLSSGIFLWFLGCLRTFLARIEGQPARLSSIAYAAGIAWIVLNLAVQAPQLALARSADAGLPPPVAVVVSDLGLALATIADVPVAVLLTAVGVLSLRDEVLPRWLGWLSVLAAAAHLAAWVGIVTDGGPLAPGGWATFVIYPVFVGWLIAVTTVMFTHTGEPVEQGGVS